MEADQLATAYIQKSRARRKALQVLYEEESYSDTVRESQEICELALKAVLRLIGIDPPKLHDVGKIVKQYASELPATMQTDVDVVARYSFQLRRDRELAFYGALDVDPAQDYTREDADAAISQVDFILEWIRPLDVSRPSSPNRSQEASDQPGDTDENA